MRGTLPPMIFLAIMLGQPIDVPVRAADNAAKLIATWYAAGTGAGHEGDLYDNRDGQHSTLTLQSFPGLKQIEYSKQELRIRGLGLQLRTLPHVTFGNSSTAYREIQRGSQARTAYSGPVVLNGLYNQYAHNNLYVYPEHRDHDPGHNGKNGQGYGDLLPTNTPYLIVSQGSSGSDRRFVAAVARTLAAFHPDVKRRLVGEGHRSKLRDEEIHLLMPTVQMILRMSAANVRSDDNYLTGAAHPSVFQPKSVDDVRMIQMAHHIRPGNLPPMVQIEVLEEDVPVNGRDYFEAEYRTEKLADTPCAIARIFRGHRFERRMVVSAEQSFDPNGHPLTFHWVVLRGDRERIRIVPRNEERSVVEIHVPYHPRQRIAWEPEMESNRVDIGVFVHNGSYFSAPAFVTDYSLDSEKRTYDSEGRIQEIDYTTGNFVDPRLTDHKPWRDAYHYAGGKMTGWTRHHEDGSVQEFTADGRLVVERDNSGTAQRTTPVRYRLDQSKPRKLEGFVPESQGK